MYKAKAKRRDDGNYDLSYGKGGKKITDFLTQNEETKVWHVVGRSQFSRKTKREVIEAWGSWAASSYAGDLSPAPENGAEDSSTESQTVDAPHDAHPDDELSQLQRHFFDVLSKKHGRLTEWQRSQCRSILRELSGEKRNVQSPHPPVPKRNSVDANATPPVGTAKAAASYGPPPKYSPKPSVPSGSGAGGFQQEQVRSGTDAEGHSGTDEEAAG